MSEVRRANGPDDETPMVDFPRDAIITSQDGSKDPGVDLCPPGTVISYTTEKQEHKHKHKERHRAVVVENSGDNLVCLRVSAYGGNATAHLPESQQRRHAIAYVKKTCPKPLKAERALSKSIRVILKKQSTKWDERSRLGYSNEFRLQRSGQYERLGQVTDEAFQHLLREWKKMKEEDEKEADLPEIESPADNVAPAQPSNRRRNAWTRPSKNAKPKHRAQGSTPTPVNEHEANVSDQSDPAPRPTPAAAEVPRRKGAWTRPSKERKSKEPNNENRSQNSTRPTYGRGSSEFQSTVLELLHQQNKLIVESIGSPTRIGTPSDDTSTVRDASSEINSTPVTLSNMFSSAAQPLDSSQPFLTEDMADSQETNRILERSEAEKPPPTVEHDASHQEAPMQMPGRVHTARELQKSPTISPLARSDIGPGWIDQDESLADYQISDKRPDSLWGERYLQDPRSTADQSGSSSKVSSSPDSDIVRQGVQQFCFIDRLLQQQSWVNVRLDTGADHNFMSARTAHRVGYNRRPYLGHEIRVGDGRTVKPEHVVSADWRPPKKTTTNWSDNFVVLDSLPYDVVIGITTIDQNQLYYPNREILDHLVLSINRKKRREEEERRRDELSREYEAEQARRIREEIERQRANGQSGQNYTGGGS